MTKPVIGAQLYTLREYQKTMPEIAKTLKKVSNIGYKTVQVSNSIYTDTFPNGTYSASVLYMSGSTTIEAVDSGTISSDPKTYCEGTCYEDTSADLDLELDAGGAEMRLREIVGDLVALTRNPEALAWIPAFAGKTNGDSFLPGASRPAELGTQNDTSPLLFG